MVPVVRGTTTLLRVTTTVPYPITPDVNQRNKTVAQLTAHRTLKIPPLPSLHPIGKPIVMPLVQILQMRLAARRVHHVPAQRYVGTDQIGNRVGGGGGRDPAPSSEDGGRLCKSAEGEYLIHRGGRFGRGGGGRAVTVGVPPSLLVVFLVGCGGGGGESGFAADYAAQFGC